jgi:hypothetical protein
MRSIGWMTDATTLGSLNTTYTKEQLDALTGGSAQYYGFDVTADGRRLLLGGQGGHVFELGERPSLSIARSGTAIVISWPASVSAQVIQSSASLTQGSFSDLSPQPPIAQDGELNFATISIGAENKFFRLRKGP